ncbi:MAG TPA: hypothetical protein PLR60_07415 [Syntrophorhabdaceae bacterium]|nr:hypothetical protein [Syntrophorhabdaceae bacterium]
MKKQIAISFENDLVKLVYAQIARSGVIVEKAMTLSNEEFDRFLATTGDDEFVVVQNFQNIHQDVLSLPPAKEKYMRQLVELEIKKRIPELKEFSFFHVDLREVQREGKRSKDVFFFAVESGEIEELVDRFARHGKVVTHIYPNVLPLSHFLQVADIEPDEPVLGVFDLGTNKTIFVVREGHLSFVRVAQSEGRGIGQIDIENINMTIAYCRQVLRMSPSRVVLLGMQEDPVLPAAPVVPLAPAKHPASVVAFDDTAREYVAPLSAILHIRELSESNLLPPAYQDVVVQRKVMAYCIIVLALLSLVGLMYLGFQSIEIAKSKSVISQLRSDINKRSGIIGEFEGTLTGLQKFAPSIEIVNSFGAAVNMQDVLVFMQFIATEGVNVQSVSMKDEKEHVLVQVQGNIGAGSYEELQSRYEHLLGEVKKAGKTEIVSHKLDLKQRSFTLDLKWKA